MDKSTYLKSKNSICKLQGTEKGIEKILSDNFTYHFIPDLKVHKNLDSYDVEITGKNMELPVSTSYPQAFYNNQLPKRDIVSLCEYFLERNRQEKDGYYSLNSATASLDKKATVFFAGATNSGKTSGMLDLIQNHGFDFYSDEHTLLDLQNKKVVGGSRSVATRKKILKNKLSNGNEFYPKKTKNDEKNASLFIYPHIDHGLDNPILYQFSPLDFHWLLSKELGGIIRGIVKFSDNFKYPLPSLDTQKLSEKRVKRTIEFTKQIPCYYFQGSLKQMSDFVKDKIRENDKKK